MKLPLILLLFIFQIYGTCYSQTWQWARSTQCGTATGGSEGWLAKTDPSGNVFIGGYFYGDSICLGHNNFYNLINADNNIQTLVAKYDSAGNLLWARAGSNGQSRPISLTTDNQGNLFVFGFFTSPTINFGTTKLTNKSFDTSKPFIDSCYYVLKYNPDGQLLWARNGGSNVTPQGDFLHPGGIATDENGNCYIATSYNRQQLIVGNDTMSNFGGTNNTTDFFVARYDAEGNFIWAKSFGGLKDDFVTDISVSKSNKIFITGYFRSGFIGFGSTRLFSQSENTFVVCFDTSGNTLWAKGSDNAGTVRSITTDQQNNVYIAGGFTSSIAFDGHTIANGNGGYYLFKFTEAGDVAATNAIYPTTNIASCCQSFGLAVDRCNNIWLSGTVDKIAGLRLDGSTTIHAPANSTDPMFFAGYNDSGTLVGYATLPSGAGFSANLANTGLAADNAGNLYLVGDYRVQNPFVIGNDSLYLHSGEASAIFVARYTPKANCDTSNTPVYPAVPVITIFPNPTNYSAILNYLGNIGTGAMVAIRDISGRELARYPITGVQTHIPLVGLSNGVYLCIVKVEGRADYTLRLVVIK